jgi:hypothetical protein
MNPPKGPSLRSLLAPADGLEPKVELFTESPIEALDWLTELGRIAKESIEPASAPTAEPASIPVSSAPLESIPPSSPTVPEARPPVPKTDESRLVDALLEYHRLRGPALGARTAPKPSSRTEFSRAEGSSEPKNHFASIEIPVIRDVAAKPDASPIRSARPTQTILRPKSPK